MKNGKGIPQFVLCFVVPYIMIVGGFTVLTDGNARTFGMTLMTLAVLRVFFALIELMGNFVCWRLFKKSQ